MLNFFGPKYTPFRYTKIYILDNNEQQAPQIGSSTPLNIHYFVIDRKFSFISVINMEKKAAEMQEVGLKRGIGLMGAVNIIIGVMIGSGNKLYKTTKSNT